MPRKLLELLFVSLPDCSIWLHMLEQNFTVIVSNLVTFQAPTVPYAIVSEFDLLNLII